MERLYIRILAQIFRDNNLFTDEATAIFTSYGSCIHQQVAILNGWYDDTKDANTYADSLRMDIVDYVSRAVEHVCVHL